MKDTLAFKLVHHVLKKHRSNVVDAIFDFAEKVLQLQRENLQLRKEVYKLRKKG